jgi:hypothetical protein
LITRSAPSREGVKTQVLELVEIVLGEALERAKLLQFTGGQILTHRIRSCLLTPFGRQVAVRWPRGHSPRSQACGAAVHYVDARNGVKDFDVWSFYAKRDDGSFPYRWRGTADYGPSKFGRYSGDPPSYTGRRVDFLGRSLRAPLDADPVAAVREYLAARNTASAKELAAKAVVLIYPQELLGQVIWRREASLSSAASSARVTT